MQPISGGRACRFAVGQTVCLLADTVFGGTVLPKGSAGTVEEVLPSPAGCAYWVKFAALSQSVQVPESALGECG